MSARKYPTSRKPHGLSQTPEHSIWRDMRARCFNEKHKWFPSYGGRGITIDPRWGDFETFLKDMGYRPSPGHSLDRINNDEPYSVHNCRWADTKQQSRNKRTTRVISWCGVNQCLQDWATFFGVRNITLTKRLDNHHWCVTKTFIYYSLLAARRAQTVGGTPQRLP